MQLLKLFCIGALTVLLYHCSLCQSYCVVYTENEEVVLQNYLIKTTDENYAISAFCKCGENVRWWQLNSEGQYKKVSGEYLVDTVNSTLMIQNYTVTKSSVLLCGNIYGSYAKAISIVIEEPHEECSSSNNSHDTIKQSSTIMLQQSSSTVVQSSSTQFPFTQSSTNIVSTSLSSWSHEDSCTEWQTQTTTKTVKTTLTVTPTTLVSRIPLMPTTTTEIGRSTLIYVGSGVGAGVIIIIVVLVVIILVLLTSLMAIKKNQYKVDDDEFRRQGSPPLESLVAVNHTAVDHRLNTDGSVLNQQHNSPSSIDEDEQSNTEK